MSHSDIFDSLRMALETYLFLTFYKLDTRHLYLNKDNN
jgi:hypothetical protein